MQATQGQEFVWTNFPKMIPATSITFGTLITPDIDVILGMGYASSVLGLGIITQHSSASGSQTVNYRNGCEFSTDNVEIEASNGLRRSKNSLHAFYVVY
ncbi:hypothetical protein ARMSODRAFT_1011458 [Armillaria solidipes]|uniref:Uncharacterized protein n=1 Tax=Armillaria solidipes TaxID=1076256 RepID=A0A2H3C2T1_9AGAR|nr:hypothetical protein ARMSODRAFT_1011458 [Armillaria solidipes]